MICAYHLGKLYIDIGVFCWRALLYILYPPVCSSCRIPMTTRMVLCLKCTARIAPIASGSLRVGKSYVIPVFAISDYKDPIRSLILAKRRSDIKASCHLAELIWQMTYLKEQKIDYIIPIPLHWSRYAWRGFNQAHEMAKVISKKSGASVVCIVKRRKKTKFQATLSVEQRVRNVSNAFIVKTSNKEQFRGKHLVLIDDLMTTGSTLQAAARELAKLKPASISAVVAARVI